LHSPGIFIRPLVRIDTTFDILSKIILALFLGSSNPVAQILVGLRNFVTGAEVRLNGVPLWWLAVVLGILFPHSLFRYAHEEKQKIEQERDEERQKREEVTGTMVDYYRVLTPFLG
jgi:hypothetical protein